MGRALARAFLDAGHPTTVPKRSAAPSRPEAGVPPWRGSSNAWRAIPTPSPWSPPPGRSPTGPDLSRLPCIPYRCSRCTPYGSAPPPPTPARPAPHRPR
ncbi:MAG: hypothetical protein ACRDRH_16855 [Pseudonocardia sp.]